MASSVIRGPPQSIEFDSATLNWLNTLRHTWGLWKKSAGVSRLLHEYYNSSENAYTSALFVMTNSGDFHQAKANSLAFTAMEEFCVWITPRKELLKHCLTKEVKFEAFKIVTDQRQPQLVKMVINTYEMSKDKAIFLDPIKKLIRNKQYKEACQSVTHMGLHEYFSVEEMLVPLVFQDKLNIATDFLVASPKHQKELVTYLDNLLGKRYIRNEADTIICRLDIPDAKVDKLYAKPLSKLVARVVKMYNLPSDICPNLNKKRREGALQFLVHKFYTDKTLSLDSFREMAAEAVAVDVSLHSEIVESCATNGDPDEALYWAKRLSVPEDRWPCTVKNKQKLLPQDGSLVEVEENWDEMETSSHPFTLSEQSIILVDSSETFTKLQEAIKKEEMVGIDSEWKPHFGTRRSELALIQVACTSQVFLIDASYLSADPTRNQQHWTHLASTLFNNPRVLKLGFGLSADLQMIRSSVPALGQINQRGNHYLDLINVWKKLTLYPSFSFPHNGNDQHRGESLSRLVELCFGSPLSKSEQFSNWELRPLRLKQKIYAALDAYCLLEVYRLLETRCNQLNIPFYDICNEVITNIKIKKHVRVKPAEKVVPPVESRFGASTNARSSWEVRFVVDVMVQGLGKELRKCGIDTVILENGQGNDFLYHVANRDQRCIVTKGRNYNELMTYVPQGYCYQVMSDDVERQLEETLQYFNVQKNPNQFARCWKCNSLELIEMSGARMRQVAASFHCEPVYDATPNFARLHLTPHESNWESEGSTSEEEGHAPPFDHHPVTVQNSEVDVGICETKYGARIAANTIPIQVLNEVQVYYVCEHCGKCYWEQRGRL